MGLCFHSSSLSTIPPRHRTQDPSFSNQKKPADEASRVPIRERVTPRRVAHRRESSQYDSGDPFTDTFRSSGGRRRKRDSIGDWSAAEEDYVEVDVDPLDPFSAANRNGSSRSSWDSSSWDSPDSEQDNDNDEWFPLVAIMGIAGLVWVLGLLGNALPAATPSLGM